MAHLVDAVVPVALGGRVLAVLAAPDVAHHADRLPRPPVLGLRPLAVVDGGAAVESQRPVGTAGPWMWVTLRPPGGGPHPMPWDLCTWPF